MTVIGHVVRRYEHRGCCERFAGRVVGIESPIDESGTYVLPTPRCAISDAELWLREVDPVVWRQLT